jgi:parallel beta-helix repeat protein
MKPDDSAVYISLPTAPTPSNRFISGIYVAWDMRWVICIVLALCFVIACFAMTGTTASTYSPPAPSALTHRAAIRIDGNAGFNAANGVTGGDGSALTPWIIENFEINGTANGTCIYIGNTTEHFIVRNCTLHDADGGDATPFWMNASVMLFNVVNGTLHNNTLNNSMYGLYLYNNCVNNTITWNNVSRNRDTGMWLDAGSDNNDINNNSVSYNGLLGTWIYSGIYIYSGTGNNLTDNQVYNNSRYGIFLYSTSNNNITDCSDYNNADAGIYLYLHSNYNIVTRCNVSNNLYGVRISTSSNNSVYHNDFINNTNQAYSNNIFNLWHNGYPSGGNYWDDYTGNDIMNGPGQNISGSDGIGDTPYTNIVGGIGANDTYPLMNPFNWTAPVDAVPPRAVSWGPVGNDVQPGTIFIQWNESMNWTSVEAAFGYTDGTVNYTSANGNWTHDLAFNSTFTPAQQLDYETTYWVTMNSTACDFAGNRLDQDGNGTGGQWPSDVLRWNFTTTDRAPYVISTVPADGQIDVDPNKPIRILFSERMNTSSVELGFSYTDGTETWNDAHGLSYWNAPMTEFTFSPAEPLGLNQTFNVTLDGTMVRDYGGKALEGGNFTWDFRTWLEPPAPHIIDTYPLAGSFNVNVNTYINVAFDTEMDPASMDIAFSYTDGTTVYDTGNGTADWFSENSLFSFQPTERLRFDTTYTVRVTSNATSVYGKKLDGNDNGIPDVNDDFVFAFTTTPEPPVVISHYPEANQMEVPISIPAIYINFSKVMSLTSVTNAVSISPSTPFTPSFSGAGMNLTLVLGAQLQDGTQYRVTVLGTATDLTGIKLDGNSDGWAGDKFSFSFFTTGVLLPVEPHVISWFPATNETGVPVDTFIGIAFNVAMNRTSVQEAFTFGNESTNLNGTFLWQSNNKALKFYPTEQLSYNMTYSVMLLGTARSEDGQLLVNATTWHFTTAMETAPTNWTDWIFYGAIIFLTMVVAVLYMANRSLRRDLKRTRVKLKRLKREMGIKDEEPDKQPPEQGETEVIPPESAEPVPESETEVAQENPE